MAGPRFSMNAHPARKLRSARRDDIAPVAELERICFADPWQERSISDGLADEKWVFLVAETGGEVIGYGIAWVVAGEGEIARVGVAPQLRGGGAGLELTQALIRECTARGAAKLFLEVRGSNVAARTVYSRAGFTIAGRRKSYYADGEDAIVMQLMVNTGESG